MQEDEWTSPDDKIYKKLILPGELDKKPYLGSEVKLNIQNCPSVLDNFNNTYIIIGDNDGDLGRLLDISICTMNLNERALFKIIIDIEEISVVIELVEFKFNGYIYQWNAEKKFSMALDHKQKGANYFNEQNYYEAGHRFNKALKIISSIPIPVGRTENDPFPENVDDVKITDIDTLKEKLYNNLSSCYFKLQLYDLVIPLCEKVLQYDSNNVKALYKIGVSYKADKNFEKAHEALEKLIKIEPHNKACAEHLGIVNQNLQQDNIRVNNLMKKMISASINK